MVDVKLRGVVGRLVDWLLEMYSFVLLRPLAGRMRREHRAISYGFREHHARLRNPWQTSASLRRAVHRLEKGLLMRPRQAVFAVEYIDQAIDAYAAAVAAAPSFDQDELSWATDVLDEYFGAVNSHKRVDAARTEYRRLRKSAIMNASRHHKTPYPHRNLGEVSVSYDALMSLSRHRKSVRWFLPKEVPKNLIEKALSIATLAPSACNRQPFLFRVVLDQERARRVAAISMGTAGYAQNIPAIVVVLGNFGALEHSRDRHLPYVDASLAAMQFMLALETLGLAGCPINWPDVEKIERRMDHELGLPRHLRPVMLIATGFPDPDGKVAFSARKSAASLVRYEDNYEI